MTRLAVDFEHPSRTWWESGGADLWEALTGEPDANHVVVDDDLATSWLREAGKLPGWEGGPEFAPHPIRAAVLAEDEEDL